MFTIRGECAILIGNEVYDMKLDVKSMCICSFFAVLIAIGAFIKLPISIVPVTMQTLFVVLAAIVLKQKKATISVLLYLIIGLIGIPIFANGGGITYVLQPTFGYLIGFLCAANIVGYLASKKNSLKYYFFISVLGMLIIYLFGMLYFIFIQKVYYGIAFEWGWVFYYLFLVYLPGDLISCGIAAWIGKRLEKVSLL